MICVFIIGFPCMPLKSQIKDPVAHMILNVITKLDLCCMVQHIQIHVFSTHAEIIITLAHTTKLKFWVWPFFICLFFYFKSLSGKQPLAKTMMNCGFHQLLQLTDGQTDILMFLVEVSLTCCCGMTVRLQQS